VWLLAIGTLAVGGIRVAVFWYERTSSAIAALRAGGLLPMSDFGMMYTAGKLALEGAWDRIYDVVAFAAQTSRVLGFTIDVGGATFPYPPPTALGFSLLARFDLSISQIMWLLLSLTSLAIGVRLMTRRWIVILPVLLMMPTYFAIRLGQNTPVALLAVAAAFVLLRRSRPLAAGLVLGLLVLKPQLLIGFILWWVVSPRRLSREALGAVLSGGGILLSSLMLVPQGWRAYVAELPTLANPPGMVPLGSFSLLDFTRFLFGPGTVTWIITAVGTAGLIAFLGVQFRRHQQDPQIGFAIAVLATVLLSPHMVSYDWLLLLVPGAIFWERFPTLRPELTFTAAILNLAALVSAEIVQRSLSSYGRALSPAFPLVVGTAVWLCWRVNRPTTLSEPAASSRS
jgi:hypothetical protein